MKTTKIFKEEITNHNIWKLILIDLELPLNADEITVTSVTKEPNNDNDRNLF